MEKQIALKSLRVRACRLKKVLDRFRTQVSNISKFTGGDSAMGTCLNQLNCIYNDVQAQAELGFHKEFRRYAKSAEARLGYSCNRPHR